jgi:anti-sigma regulatory factor (Ser/Thr protein kinase)
VPALQHRDNAVVVTLPFRASSVRSARSRLRGDLRRARVPTAAIDDATVVLSELIGNAVRHAQPLESGRLLITWRVDGDTVWVEVTDGGSDTIPRVEHSGDDDVGGRGLTIVDALSRRWFVRRAGERSTVTAEIPVS